MATRKDYVLISSLIKSVRGYSADADAVLDSLVYRFVGALKADNPKFDEKRFITDCGSN